MIHTNLKVIVVVTGAILLLILSVFYLWEKREKAVAKDEEMDAGMADISYGELEIKDYLLPLENSETRSTPISHVMLHFSSNVTEKPHTPYQVEDIHKIFMDYGVSAHYVIDPGRSNLQVCTRGSYCLSCRFRELVAFSSV